MRGGIKAGILLAAALALGAAIYLSITDRYVGVESKALDVVLHFSCGKGLSTSDEYTNLVEYYSSTENLVETGVGQRIEAECRQEKAKVLVSYLVTGALVLGGVIMQRRGSSSRDSSEVA